MIDLYYWGTPNGHKITIALEEMGLEYKIFPINILENDQFQPDFLRISPNNKIPAIVDQDGPRGEPISVFESGAILQYLGRKTGLFYPDDEQQRVEVEQWLMWQMGGLGPCWGRIITLAVLLLSVSHMLLIVMSMKPSVYTGF